VQGQLALPTAQLAFSSPPHPVKATPPASIANAPKTTTKFDLLSGRMKNPMPQLYPKPLSQASA